MSFFTDLLDILFPVTPATANKGKIIYNAPIGPTESGGFLDALLSIFFPNTGNAKSIEDHAYSDAYARLQVSEGNRQDVYYDTRGILTVGIGHKVVASDNLKLGDVITPERVFQLFKQDSTTAFNAAKSQAQELGRYTPDFIAALTEVNFQLGTGWRSKFPNTWKLLKSGNWQQAIENLQQSAWYQQTPNRVLAFIASIENNFG